MDFGDANLLCGAHRTRSTELGALARCVGPGRREALKRLVRLTQGVGRLDAQYMGSPRVRIHPFVAPQIGQFHVPLLRQLGAQTRLPTLTPLAALPIEDLPAQFRVEPFCESAAVCRARTNRRHQRVSLPFWARAAEPRARRPVLGGHDAGGPLALLRFPTPYGAQRNPSASGVASVQLLALGKSPLHIEVPMLV